jgi:ApaG protein
MKAARACSCGRGIGATDAEGHTEHVRRTEPVRTEGVVGMTPILRPGASFRYTSGCQLGTPSGIMAGSFQMMTTEARELIDVAIPAVSLDSPHAKRSLN